MKILILEANPYEDLSLDKEIRSLTSVINDASDRNKFRIKDSAAVRKDKLQDLLLALEAEEPKEEPIIVHFCGHGTGEQGLVFENDQGEKDLVSTKVIADLFALFKKHVACIVLNACYSQVQAEAINEHIKYVIGMKQSIRDDAAIAFSVGFYRALGYGRSFEDAFNFGTNAIQLGIITGSQSRDAIVEHVRKLLPIDNVPEAPITEEHLKPVFYQKKLLGGDESSKQEHFKDVLNAIKRGIIVPFLGPSINLCDRPRGTKASDWDSEGDSPPTRSELAFYLEDTIFGTKKTKVQCPLSNSGEGLLPDNCPINEDISFTRLLFQHVLQRSKVRRGEQDLKDALSNIATHPYEPNKLHEFLARLPKTLNYETPILIVTANFDRTLERAFEEAKQPFDLVSYIDSKKCFLHQKFRKDNQKPPNIVLKDEKLISKPNDYKEFDFYAYPVILKLYSPVDWAKKKDENFVSTEDHFINYLAQRPIGDMLVADILNKLQNNHIWFLGYGLSNWDERVPLHRIWNGKKHRRQWWAVQSNPKALDISLWQKNDVKLITMPLEHYIKKLDQLLQQLSPN